MLEMRFEAKGLLGLEMLAIDVSETLNEASTFIREMLNGGEAMETSVTLNGEPTFIKDTCCTRGEGI